jgi:hypothetical protein
VSRNWASHYSPLDTQLTYEMDDDDDDIPRVSAGKVTSVSFRCHLLVSLFACLFICLSA